MQHDKTGDVTWSAPPPRDPPAGPAAHDRPEREPSPDESQEALPGYGPDPDYVPDSVEPDPTPELPEPPCRPDDA